MGELDGTSCHGQPCGATVHNGPDQPDGSAGRCGLPASWGQGLGPQSGAWGAQPEEPRQLILESDGWSPLTSGGTAATLPLSWCPRLCGARHCLLPFEFSPVPVLRSRSGLVSHPRQPLRREGVCVCEKLGARGVRPRPQCPQAPVQPGTWGATHPGVSPHKRTGRPGALHRQPAPRPFPLGGPPPRGSGPGRACTGQWGSWGADRGPLQGVHFVRRQGSSLLTGQLGPDRAAVLGRPGGRPHPEEAHGVDPPPAGAERRGGGGAVRPRAGAGPSGPGPSPLPEAIGRRCGRPPG